MSASTYTATLLAVVLTAASYADDTAPKAGPKSDPAASRPNVFDLPRLQAIQAVDQAQTIAMMNRGEYAAAAERLFKAIERVPHDPTAHYNLACALARQNKTEAALASLEKAVEFGFRNRQHISADDDLKSLRNTDRFQAVLAAAEKPLAAGSVGWKFPIEPAVPAAGQVVVDDTNVAWDARIGMFRVLVKFADDAADQPVAAGLGQAGDLLRSWYDEESAAGNHGDLYDNHDSDHSNMNFRGLPQLTRVEFAEAAKKRQLHHGLQRFFLYNKVTIGNSSTALTSGPFWRSQGRLAVTRRGGPQQLYLQYRANQLYFYPEHRDHDPAGEGKGHGDVFPANTPYLILSQGSSGSDRVFLNAVAQTLAAFRPAVKAKLATDGLLMPTVQMIFRQSNKQVASTDDYLTGKAHPTVFDGKQLDVVKMVTLAHDLEPDSLPPLVQLRVVKENTGTLGRDYFDAQPSEVLFDTPCALARVVKSTQYARRLVVSAEDSVDPTGKPLRFHWVTLRGDADRIEIKPTNDSGSVAEIVVPYHRRQPLAEGSAMESCRVDIGVFAHNGDYYSAPAFLSFYYLPGELRVYDDQHRIQSVDYNHQDARRAYVDPLLDARKDWRDEYRYDNDGKLTGWTRFRGDQKQQFTAAGKLIVKQDDEGLPLATAEVRYVAKVLENRTRVLVQETLEQPAE